MGGKKHAKKCSTMYNYTSFMKSHEGPWWVSQHNIRLEGFARRNCTTEPLMEGRKGSYSVCLVLHPHLPAHAHAEIIALHFVSLSPLGLPQRPDPKFPVSHFIQTLEVICDLGCMGLAQKLTNMYAWGSGLLGLLWGFEAGTKCLS